VSESRPHERASLNIALQEGDIVSARKLFEQTLSLLEEAQDERGSAIALGNLGATAIESGDYRERHSCSSRD
jgi:hypothetical protein